MKKHLPSAIILFVLLLAFCFHAFAAETSPIPNEYVAFHTLRLPFFKYIGNYIHGLP